MATAATKTAPKKTARSDGLWSVIDLNVLNPLCSTPTRQHEVLEADGKTRVRYDLPGVRDKETRHGCKMPADHALRFLSDPSFNVFDADGKLVQPLRPQTSTQGVSLQRNETVATFHELTRDALFARARRLAGGQLLPANTTNAKLIELLMTGGAPGTERVEGGDDDLSVDPGDGEDDVEMNMEGGDLTDGLAARKAEIMAQLGNKGTGGAGNASLEDAGLA